MPTMARLRIALIAHDNRKRELLHWARTHLRTLGRHQLYATRTTGNLLKSKLGVAVTCFLSGPLGGDQQVGAALVEGRIDIVVFFWDPLQPQPHDADVKALLRVAVVHNVPLACNVATADILMSSLLMQGDLAPRRLKEMGAPADGLRLDIPETQSTMEQINETVATDTHPTAGARGQIVSQDRGRVAAA